MVYPSNLVTYGRQGSLRKFSSKFMLCPVEYARMGHHNLRVMLPNPAYFLRVPHCFTISEYVS